jgi:glycogen debranching enzyme
MAEERSDIIRVQDVYYILATSALADDRTRVLKHGETFALFDRYGDIQPVGLGEQGIYHEGTRYLNRLEFRLEDNRPLLLSSFVKEDNSVLSVDMTNQDISRDGTVILPRDTVQLVRFKFLWDGACYERFWMRNFALHAVSISFSLHFEADFKDIFEIRGVERKHRGKLFKPSARDGVITFSYEGLDGMLRQAIIQSNPRPNKTKSSEMKFKARLKAKSDTSFYIYIQCRSEGNRRRVISYDKAFTRVQGYLRNSQSGACEVETSNQRFNDWLHRSRADLKMMITETPQGPYPYAGVPWFSTAFGRDGIITAMETLWMNPGLARGVLSYLAARQATTADERRDSEPGKIIHEVRSGEMAALGEIPFGCYYGSVDSTPLFIMLAGMYYERTADRDFMQAIWPNVERALDWIDNYGDRDGDGFVEYERQNSEGLIHQGWKDSQDAIFHVNGRDAIGPIALCEVQAYVYGAKLWAAELARALGKPRLAAELRRRARELQEKFEKMFWSERIKSYALALDGKKKPCLVRVSNAGHCLFAGIAGRAAANRLAKTLLDKSSYSGWGVRTVAEGESRYNPMSYHNGSIWPHDNALIALGLARYGHKAQVLKIFRGFYEASIVWELHRMPELFCGFRRREGIGPTTYPLACSPQAWAAGAVFMFLQASLGININARHSRITFQRPVMPGFLYEIEIRNLAVNRASIDLLLRRDNGAVTLNVLRRRGNIDVVITK